MTAADIRDVLHESLIDGVGQQIYIVLLANGEEVGREPVATKYVIKYNYKIVNEALRAIEQRVGQALLGKKITYGLAKF